VENKERQKNAQMGEELVQKVHEDGFWPLEKLGELVGKLFLFLVSQ
jgi:hypothetical protein